jgi:hypothetical protein
MTQSFLLDSLAARFEEHQKSWVKLFRIDKQKLIEEINRMIGWASDPNST